MAGATRPAQASTSQVVNILNQSGESSSKKRKVGAHRSVGRPRKRSKTAKESDLTTNAADVEPASQKQDKVELKPTASTSGKLRNTRTSASSGRSHPTVKATNEDMFNVPRSPKAASPATEQQDSGDEGECNLRNSVFAELPTSKEAEGELAKPSSRTTRSRAARTTQPKATEPQSRPTGPVRTVRNLRARPSGGKAVIKDSGNLGYPSPEKRVSTKDELRKAVSRPAASFPSTRQSISKRSETTLGTTDGRDSDYVEDEGEEDEGEEEEGEEEEGEEEEAAARSESDAANEEEGVGQNGAIIGEETSQQEHGEGTQTTDEQTTETDDGEGGQTAADTNNQESKPSKSRSKFDEAAEHFHCRVYWTAAWDAAKRNQHKSDPKTKPVRDLLEAIRRFKDALRMTVKEVQGQEEDLLSEPADTDLKKFATAMGNLKKSASRTGEREKRLIRDIYLYAIPKAVGLLRSLLIVRSAGGELGVPALEEMVMVIKATRRLCERIYHWKPGFHLEDKVKSRTNLDINLSLKSIEEQYEAALSKFKTKEYMTKGKVWEKEFEEKQARLAEERVREISERRRNMARWAIGAEAEAQTRIRSREHIKRSPGTLSDHEVFDTDDVDLHDSLPATNGFTREATEDIPGPTKRLWLKEETIALLLLLQKYRGPDRYEKIQETIREIARDIRKLGPDRILTTPKNQYLDIDFGAAGDVLDDLGLMEVTDIEQQAKYLKASQAREMDRHVQATGNREKWAWLASV